MIFQLQHHLFAFVTFVFTQSLELESQPLNGSRQFLDFLTQVFDFFLVLLGRSRQVKQLLAVIVFSRHL